MSTSMTDEVAERIADANRRLGAIVPAAIVRTVYAYDTIKSVRMMEDWMIGTPSEGIVPAQLEDGIRKAIAWGRVNRPLEMLRLAADWPHAEWMPI